ncbi:tunicamycin resistance protein [Acidaminobacter sp. JC074]|uniref:AAA family ATPase n=1 Tax=Acidaminobacter sp. JC074 TaxID=2530199 RepID=UPI001F0DAD40|nr:AAA family ATPase [Acidaminobacter sp. JC074]MCH4886220.1 tunicamycin resistance protein [Acidaminobacter sp. JC074]
MIIWINGGFGSGKTQTAFELEKRLDNAYVFDPERTGFYIRANMPKKIMRSDFQDYSVWRTCNAEMLSYFEENFDGILICPMTVTDKGFFKEMTDHLDKENFHHFTLRTSRETLYKRLRKRGEKKNSWAIAQIDRCIDHLSDDFFPGHIHTDDMSIDDVVDHIGKACGLALKEDNRSSLKKRWDRFLVWKGHTL